MFKRKFCSNYPNIRVSLQFHLDPSQVGLVFLFLATFYAISAPFWGWLCDKVVSKIVVTHSYILIIVLLRTASGDLDLVNVSLETFSGHKLDRGMSKTSENW
jgi:nitrate/nitrite transporter NarK